MSYSFKLWSHPEKLLISHITNVYKNGVQIYERISLDSQFNTVLDLCLLLHDFGKASAFFQKYIHAIDDKEKGRINEDEFEKIKYELGKRKNHARISAIWVFIVIEQKLQLPLYSLIGFITVLRHHGHFTNLEDMLTFSSEDFDILRKVSRNIDYEEYHEILKSNGYTADNFNHQFFEEKLDGFFNTRLFRRNWKRERESELTPELFYKSSLAFSILLAADKGECIFDGVIFKRGSIKLPSDLVDNYKVKTFGSSKKDELNLLRDQVYDSVSSNIQEISLKDRFLSVNVPTGIGKTLTVINAVLKLVDKRSDLEKIIYCLPFTSVIDQNAQVIAEILESNGIVESTEHLSINHHLAELKYKANAEEEINDNESEFLINQFESNINVTTFYQLLYGIYTGKNNEIKKLHSFANSVIILDEVQSIPSIYWPLIKETFIKLAEKLNITFVFVTATLPLIFSEEKGEIIELVDNKELIFNSLDRISLDSTLLSKSITEEELIQILKEDIHSNQEKSFLVILNTIKASKNIYRGLKDENLNLVYLSTSIPPIERLRRIKKIKTSLEPLVVVSTQLVEAGVDIDLDIVYRDIAPLDSIFQSAGRCNRNAKNAKGIVKIFSLLDNTRRYASYIYGQADLDLTKVLLTQKNVFKESDFYGLGKKYFEEIAKIPKDESIYILEEMRKLNYSNAFDPRFNKNEQAFELIKDRVTYPAYITYEPEANQLLNKYLETIKLEFKTPFEKKRKIKSILKSLSKYSVSVPEKYASDSFFYIISEEQQDFSYDHETGIEFEDSVGIFI